MYIPMGTIVTVCMFLTVIFANRFPKGGLNGLSPNWLLKIVGVIVGAAGFWNVLWYGLQHYTEFWGLMALGSGALMILLSVQLTVPRAKDVAWLNAIRPIAIVALLGFALYYAKTIHSL